MTSRTAYERWQEGLDQAVRDRKWNVYDCEITMTVDEFNLHLNRTPGFKALDWKHQSNVVDRNRRGKPRMDDEANADRRRWRSRLEGTTFRN